MDLDFAIVILLAALIFAIMAGTIVVEMRRTYPPLKK